MPMAHICITPPPPAVISRPRPARAAAFAAHKDGEQQAHADGKQHGQPPEAPAFLLRPAPSAWAVSTTVPSISPTLTAIMMSWGAVLMAKKASSWPLARPTRIVSTATITTSPARASITGKARVKVR